MNEEPQNSFTNSVPTDLDHSWDLTLEEKAETWGGDTDPV